MVTMDLNTIGAVCGIFTVVGGAVLTWQKIARNIAKSKKSRDAAILQEAKEAISKVKIELEAGIKANSQELENLKANVDKDLSHLRETYNGEIRNLGQKIEDLRSELRNQHGQLVQLLSKMIENRE